MLFKKKEKENVQVIIDEKVVSLGDLKKKARKTNTRFWCLIVGTSMLSSMVLPYMSLASTYSAGSSDVFTGNIIIPGYSMGGVHVSAYGVDLNKWGKISKDAVVGSNFGIWSGERFKKASSNITNEVDGKRTELMESKQSANYNLDEAEKAIGWKAITGRAGYSAENPDGVKADEQSNMTDYVAPYRTTSDYNFWDARKPTSSDAGSASVDVTLYADFIIVGVAKDADGNEVVVPLESPDDVESSEEGVAGILFDQNRVSKENKVVSSAIPRYISLRDLFDKYAESDGKLNTPEGATLANLLDCVKDKDGNASILTSLAKDDSKDLLSSKTSTYKCINNPNLSEESTAFNPYPYSMVFSYNTGKGNIISSIYSNEEAYVYFSPSSAYSQYMALRKEYEAIKAESSTEIANHDPVVAIRLGYYLAEMAILEAYLDEALPQDMTRGYVGPSEPSTVVDVNSTDPNRTIAGDGKVKASAQVGSGASAEDFQKLSYATIMYDVVKAKLQNVSGDSYRLGETNSIMDTLSTFGYASSYVDANTKKEIKPAITTGVMKGMTGNDLLMRYNLFTPYHESQLQIREAEAVYPEDKKDEDNQRASNNARSGLQEASNGTSDENAASYVRDNFEDLGNGSYRHYSDVYDVRIQMNDDGTIIGGTVWSRDGKRLATLTAAEAKGYVALLEQGKNRQAVKYLQDIVKGSSSDGGSDSGGGGTLPSDPGGVYDVMASSGKARHYTTDDGKLYRPGSRSPAFVSGEWYEVSGGNGYNYGVLYDSGGVTKGTYYFACIWTGDDGKWYFNYGDSASDARSYIASALGMSAVGLDVDVDTISIPEATADSSINQTDIEATVPSTAGTTESRKLDQEAALAGMYIPPYYPIQQHKLPDAEKPYRFQILSAVPYEVLIQYIKQNGFVNGVSLSYSSEEDASISKITNVEEGYNAIDATEAVLAARYGDSEKAGAAANLFLYDTNSTRLAKMMSLGSGTGYSVDDLKMQDPLNPTESERKKVTAARIDSALVAFAANAMTADNVHDLFDVVRATKGLKYETWFRFYNPIKSEGGDGDLFVTRISPALTTYMPAILFNGYTAAGGAEIAPDLATANCSFDYYSTPSFAPCFASHTASNCYYGVLTYEQRAFFSSEFIRTLSSTAGIPAVDAYEHLTEQIARLKEDSKSEQAVTWTNLATVYIMAKRLAYIEMCADVCNCTPLSFADIGAVLGAPSSSDSFKWNLKDQEGHDTQHHVWHIGGDYNGSGNGWYVNSKEGGGYALDWDAVYSRLTVRPAKKSVRPIADLKYDIKDVVLVAEADDTACKLAAGAFAEKTSNPWKGEWFDGCDNHDFIYIVATGSDGSTWPEKGDDEGDQGKYSKLSNNLFISAYYEKHLNSLLGPNGKYYWTNMDTIKEKLISKGTVPEVDPNAGGSVDKKEFYKHSVAFHGGIASLFVGKSLADGTVIKAYEDKIKEACAEIALAMTNIGKDMKLLTQAMPNQMQNCLAWGDYQNSSDSENQFQQDPTQANVTVNVQEDPSRDLDLQTLQDKGVTSKKDVEQYGFKVQETPNNDETFAQIGIDDEATDANGSLQAKMVRGVEGATWTSTTQPAEYTMTCTIGRVDSMAQESGTTYPYSGLANGRLQSGTDQYAMMQSHVIDYTSIASGIAGDLATRQRAKVVAITNPEYSSITDFLNILGNIGALFGELGKSMLKTMSEAFSSMFFKSSNAETQSIAPTGNNKDKAKAKADTILYRTPSGITMNRLPASATTFNSDTGQLEQSAISVDSGSPISNAAASERVSAFSGLLINQGYALYSLLQTLGLTLVLVFVGFIAFSNFYAYAINNDTSMLVAQTQLKVVLPRTILAIFMIGLPPMAGSIGFEGGNYIVLSIINNVMEFIADIFFNLNGNGVMSLWDIDLVSTFGADIFAYLLFFLAALVMSACFLVGIVSLIIQTFVLFGFFLVGPIAWAFYVWPYSASMEAKNGQYGATSTSKFSAITDKLNFGMFTGHRAGNLAPMGLLFNFTVIAGLTVAWALIFWLISMIFLGTTGAVTTSNPTAAASAIHSTGYPQATAALLGDSNSDLFEIFGVGSSPQLPALRIIFATAICVAAFYIMVKLMLSTFHEAIGFSNSIAGRLANTAKNSLMTDGKLDPTKMAAAASKGADVLGKIGGAPGAAAKATKGALEGFGKKMDSLDKKQAGLAAKRQEKKSLREAARGTGAEADAAKEKLAAMKKEKEAKRQEKRKALADSAKAKGKNALSTAKNPAKALSKRLAALSEDEAAEKWAKRLNAGNALLDDLGKGNVLGMVGNGLNARNKMKREDAIAGEKAERDLNKKVLEAAEKIARHGKDADLSDIDHQTKAKLQERGLLGADGSVSGNKGLAEGLAQEMEARNKVLDKSIRDKETWEKMHGAFTNEFGKGNKQAVLALTAAMGGAGTTEEKAKELAHEGEVQALLQEKSLSDTEANREYVEKILAAEQKKISISGSASGLEAARRKNAGVYEVMHAIEDFEDDNEKLAFIQQTFGAPPSQEEYYRMLSQLDRGDQMSKAALTSMAAYEAWQQVTGTPVAEAAMTAYNASQMNAALVAQQQAAWEGRSDVAIGKIDESHWANGHVTSVPMDVFSKYTSAASVSDMAESVTATMTAAGIDAGMANALVNFATANRSAKDMSSAVGNLNSMIGDFDTFLMGQWVDGKMSEAEMETLRADFNSNKEAYQAAMDVMAQATVGYGRRAAVDGVNAKLSRVTEYNDVVASTTQAGEVFAGTVMDAMPMEMRQLCDSQNVFSAPDGRAYDAKTIMDNLEVLFDPNNAESTNAWAAYHITPNDAIEMGMRVGVMYTGLAKNKDLKNACHIVASSRFGDDLDKLESGSYYGYDTCMEDMSLITGGNRAFAEQIGSDEYRVAKLAREIATYNDSVGRDRRLDDEVVGDIVFAVKHSSCDTLEDVIKEQALARIEGADESTFSKWNPSSVDDYLFMGGMMKSLAYDKDNGFDMSRLTDENVSAYLSSHRVADVDPNNIRRAVELLTTRNASSGELAEMFDAYDRYEQDKDVCEKIGGPLETFMTGSSAQGRRAQKRKTVKTPQRSSYQKPRKTSW